MEGPPGLCGHSKTTASHPVNEMTSKLFSAITTTAVMATVASLFPGDILSHLSDPPSEIITAVMTQPPPLGLHLSCPLSPTSPHVLQLQLLTPPTVFSVFSVFSLSSQPSLQLCIVWDFLPSETREREQSRHGESDRRRVRQDIAEMSCN